MKMNSKIYYLHYILNFIDNKYRICSLLDETYCSKSILGIDTDSFQQCQSECYQFIYKKYHCYVKSLINDHQDEIEKELWIESYVQENYHKIFNNQNYNMKNHVYTKNNGINTQKIFYVKKIGIKLTMEVFDKIINDPNTSMKEYTSYDIFSICYSYAFSFLDNKSIIMKNILFLISQRKINLDDIHREFIKFISEKNASSDYFKKFKELLQSKGENDIQYHVECFIFDHYNHIYDDDFLKELFHWKMKLANMFALIRQIFCFQILTDNDDSIIIYHDINYKYIFKITTEDIDSISLMFSEDYIISYGTFRNGTRSFLLQILNLNQKMNINIDITNFYIKLYKYEQDDLMDEVSQFNNFLIFLLETKKPIIIFLKNHQLVVENKKNTNILKVTKKNIDDFFIMDELVLVSKKIIISEIYLYNNLLNNIAQIIINDFKTKIGTNMQDILFNNNGQIQTCGENNILNFNLSSNSLIHNKIQMEHINDCMQTISFCGGKNFGSQLIGLKYTHQKFTNFEFISGVFDDKFSLFKLNTIFDENESQKISEFVSRISELFHVNSCENYEFSNMNQCFDLLDFEPNDKKFIIFHLHPQLSGFESQESCFSLNKRFKSDYNHLMYHCTADPELEYQSEKNQCFKIYHNVTFEKNHSSFEIEKKQTLSLPCINSDEVDCDFLIEKSNFHFIISRIIELKSIDKQKSSIYKNVQKSISKLIISHCIVKFLKINFPRFDQISLKNCYFENILHIKSNFLDEKDHCVLLSDMKSSQPVYIDDFLKISQNNEQNSFLYTKKYSSFKIKVSQAKVNFIDKIPAECVKMNISNCQIVIEDDILMVDHILLSKNESNKMTIPSFYSKISDQIFHNSDFHFNLKISDSDLPKNLFIVGIYNSIEIENCSSSFHINSLFVELKINDQKHEFSVENIINSVSPKCPENTVYKDKYDLILENHVIECLENIDVNSIFISNCSINHIFNLKCKILNIQNSECTFELKMDDQISVYSDSSLNLEIESENNLILINCDV